MVVVGSRLLLPCGAPQTIRRSLRRYYPSIVVGPGSTHSIDVYVDEHWTHVVASIRVWYDPSATAGIRVMWMYSPDGLKYDTDDDAVARGNYYDMSFAAGATRQTTIPVPALSRFVRIAIRNMDTTYRAVVDVSYWFAVL